MNIRTIQPSNDNKYYLSVNGGGYNKCILGNANNKYNKRPTEYSVLPNCVGYCYGRYLEYWNLTSANLPTCNAKDWYSTANARGFKCSKEPSVGAVAVFAGTTYGHVAFIERIESNGDLYLSESNWGHQIFRNVSVKKSTGYNYSSGLKLVGFVANPNAPKVEAPTETTTKKTVITSKKVEYTKGSYKVTNADVLNVRTGAGKNYPAKTYKELTLSARTKIKKLTGEPKDGYVKGLTFDVKEIIYKDNYHWGKTASGYVALEFCEKIK